MFFNLWRFLRSNASEQLRFEFEKIFGIKKHAEKVRKICLKAKIETYMISFSHSNKL